MKARKKPVTVEVFPFVMPMADTMPEWLRAAFAEGKVYYQGGDAPYLTIETLEGNHRADLGDWVIQGVKGELYPCKPDIFDLTYDMVE